MSLPKIWKWRCMKGPDLDNNRSLAPVSRFTSLTRSSPCTFPLALVFWSFLLSVLAVLEEAEVPLDRFCRLLLLLLA